MGPPQILDHLLLPFFHFNIMLLRPTVSPLTGSEASVWLHRPEVDTGYPDTRDPVHGPGPTRRPLDVTRHTHPGTHVTWVVDGRVTHHGPTPDYGPRPD